MPDRGNGPGEPTETTLGNGLRVITLPSDAPVAAVHLWLECGAADEKPGESGIAHFLEHMAFKGTATRGIGQSAMEVEALGGDLNAFTAYDHTLLQATVEGGGWSEALDVIADMVQFPKFDADELARERDVVLEEMRGYDDDPDSVVHDMLQHLLYGAHPYARPVIGVHETVSRLSVDAVRRFWSDGWGPARAYLAVVGPVDPAAVEAAARRALGGWAGGVKRGAIATAERASAERLVVKRDPDLETTAIELGWLTPDRDMAEVAALDLAAAALGQGDGAALPVRLQLRDGIAAGAWAELTSRLGGGVFGAGWLPTEDRTIETLQAALDEIHELATAGPSARQLSRVRDIVMADLIFGEETVDGLAGDLLWYRVNQGSWASREAYRRAIAATRPEDVRDAAARWLTPDALRLGAVGPKLSESALRKVVDEHRKRPARRPGKRGEILRSTLPGGTRLVLAPDAGGTAAIRIIGLGGGLVESAKTAGATSAWSRMVSTGSGDLDAIAFAEQCDALGGVIDGFAGRSTQGISASFPASNLRDGIALVGDIALSPAFDPEEWERVCSEMQEEVETLTDEPEELAWRKVWAALYPGHPWRLPVGGTVPSLDAIRPARLLKLHQQWARPENLVIAVAGGFDPDSVREAILAWHAHLPDGGEPIAARPAPEPAGRGLRESRAGHTQAHVLAAVRGVATDSKHRPAIELGAAILSAQGGRLFYHLREKLGLAYSVWAESLDGVDGGVFAAGLATSPERIDEARTALVAELARFAEDGPTQDEVDRNRRMVLGQVAASLQRASSRAADLASAELFGLPSGLDGARASLQGVDARAVREAFAALDPGDPLVVVVRPG